MVTCLKERNLPLVVGRSTWMIAVGTNRSSTDQQRVHVPLCILTSYSGQRMAAKIDEANRGNVNQSEDTDLRFGLRLHHLTPNPGPCYPYSTQRLGGRCSHLRGRVRARVGSCAVRLSELNFLSVLRWCCRTISHSLAPYEKWAWPSAAVKTARVTSPCQRNST
jgi:hypothetical protein